MSRTVKSTPGFRVQVSISPALNSRSVTIKFVTRLDSRCNPIHVQSNRKPCAGHAKSVSRVSPTPARCFGVGQCDLSFVAGLDAERFGGAGRDPNIETRVLVGPPIDSPCDHRHFVLRVRYQNLLVSPPSLYF